MKSLLLLALCLITGHVFAQATKVTIKNETYYLTKEIGYPIVGTYKYDSKNGEPIVQLNADGTGLFQLHDMQPTKMVWGIESDAQGKAKKVEGPAGAKYRLWYQIKEKNKGKGWESGVVDSWDVVEIAISFTNKKAYILGERVKEL